MCNFKLRRFFLFFRITSCQVQFIVNRKFNKLNISSRQRGSKCIIYHYLSIFNNPRKTNLDVGLVVKWLQRPKPNGLSSEEMLFPISVDKYTSG